jgi:5'(3')-deoxyribonucleotidase
MYSTSDVVAAGTSVMMISATTTTIKSPLSEYQSLSNTSLTIGMLTYKCVIVYKNKSITTFEFLQDEQPSSLVTFRAEQIIL